jgi:hypothetical protein
MAKSSGTPFPPRLSIARMAEVWDIGVNPPVFVDRVIRHYLNTWRRDGRYRVVWVIGEGSMPQMAYMERLTPALGDLDFDKIVSKRFAEEILLGPDDIPELAALFDVPLPSFLAAWQAGKAPQAPRPSPGRPTERDRIRKAYGQLTPEQRTLRGAALRWAIRHALHPELDGSRKAVPINLGDTAIDTALKDLIARGSP